MERCAIARFGDPFLLHVPTSIFYRVIATRKMTGARSIREWMVARAGIEESEVGRGYYARTHGRSSVSYVSESADRRRVAPRDSRARAPSLAGHRLLPVNWVAAS